MGAHPGGRSVPWETLIRVVQLKGWDYAEQTPSERCQNAWQRRSLGPFGGQCAQGGWLKNIQNSTK